MFTPFQQPIYFYIVFTSQQPATYVCTLVTSLQQPIHVYILFTSLKQPINVYKVFTSLQQSTYIYKVFTSLQQPIYVYIVFTSLQQPIYVSTTIHNICFLEYIRKKQACYYISHCSMMIFFIEANSFQQLNPRKQMLSFEPRVLCMLFKAIFVWYLRHVNVQNLKE